MGVNVSKDKPEQLHAYPSQRRTRRNTQSNIEVVRSLHRSLEKRSEVRRPSGKSNKFFQANKRTGRRQAITQESPLSREYNAWLRSLANNIDEDETPRRSRGSRSHGQHRKESGGWYSTLRDKVNSLMRSKRHRESSIVWPETSNVSLQQGHVTPKVRLSFAPDKQYVKELRKQIVDSHKRRSVADFNLKHDEFDPAAFYMEQSFQCTDTSPYVARKASKSIESIQSAIASERLKRNSIRTGSHGSSSSDRKTKQRKPSRDEGKNNNKYQWDVAYDPYGGIQGTSCVMGPKVLPTSNDTWKNIATSSSNLSKSSKSSNDILEEEGTFVDHSYSSFYGNDVQQSRSKHAKKHKKQPREKRDEIPAEQDFVMFRTPQSTQPSKMEQNYSMEQDYHSSRETINALVEDEERKTSRWERNAYETPSMYQRVDLGPGGENFMFGGTHDAVSTGDNFTDEGIVTKSSFTSNELTVPGTGTFPRSKAAPSPQLLWKTDSKMASSLKSLKQLPSPYHQMAADRSYRRKNEAGSSRHFSSQDDFYSEWDEDFLESPRRARRSQNTGYVSDYDTMKRSASNENYAPRHRYNPDSARRREVARYQSPVPPSVSRNSNAMDEMLEDKIDSMVRSLFRENQSQSKRSRKSRRSRNTSATSSTGGADASQAFVREMIESKLASALTSALVPNHPSNRNLYK